MNTAVSSEVNYKNKRKYKTAKYPIRQPLFFTWLIWVLSNIMLIGTEKKIEKVNMGGLKPPYMLLCNHMQFIDFEICSLATYPHRLNNVVSIDGYYRRPWLMELIGAICTRKFTTDLHLIRSIRRVLERGDVLCMYPEARYSPCGVNSFIPDSLGGLIKKNGVPVVTILHRGNYLRAPFWNYRQKRKVPLHATMTQILTREQIAEMTPDEINKVLREALTYNEYEYQKNNNIRITEPFRAEGLHKILYKCPHCMAESKMATAGSELYCEACGKRWILGEDGILTAQDGETEFPHVPDWFDWEREQVRAEIERGEYRFEDEVDIYSMPRCWRFEKLGKGKLTHDPENGFVLEGHHRGEDFRVQRMPLHSNSLHVEYDYCYIKPFDCVDISTEHDSFYCYPTKPNVITKLGFATEEIYLRSIEKSRATARSK